MVPLESAVHSFILRIWLEESTEKTGQLKWRGHITHVPSEERRYFEDLNAIKTFISPYFQIMGDEES